MHLVQLLQESGDHIARPFVEVACRFIGEQVTRVANQGSRQNHTLLLASGKLSGTVMCTCSQANFI